MRRNACWRFVAALAGASLLAASAGPPLEAPVASVSLPPLRLLALDVDAQGAVIAVDEAAPAAVAAGEPVEGLPGYHVRRVLADRVVLEKRATAGAEGQLIWVHALRPGEERSRVRELFAAPPPGTLDVRPQLTAVRPAAEAEAASDPRGKIVTVTPPPPEASEPPP